MFRKLSAILIALLLCLTAAGAETLSPTEKMVGQWKSYLAVKEQLHQSQLRMFDTIIAFDEARTWDTLLQARAATAQALTTRSAIGSFKPEPDMSAMEQARLVMAGVEVAAYQNAMNDLERLQPIALSNLLGTCQELEEGVLRQDGLATLAYWARNNRELAESDARYLCLMTNNLCITLGDDALAENLWASLTADYPGLAAYCGPYRTDADEIFNLAVAEVDLRDEINARGTTHIGENMNDLNHMQYDAAQGNNALTKEDAVIIDGMPTMLPVASWLDVGMDYYAYYTIDAEGNLQRLDVLADPTVVPEISSVTTMDVRKAEVAAYVEWLLKIGMKVRSERGNAEDEADWSCTLTAGKIQLMINWKQSSVTLWNVGNHVAFVPDWYVILTR